MQKLDPKAKWLEFYTLFPFGVVILAIISIIPSLFLAAIYLENLPMLRKVVMWGTFPFLVLVWGIISYYLAKKAYNSSGFELTEEGIKFKKGTLDTEEYFVPYSEIENVSYRKGVELTYARLTSLSGFRMYASGAIGLYTIYINTDRTMLEEMVPTSKLYTEESDELQGLSKDQAERVYEKILERSDAKSLREQREQKVEKVQGFMYEHPLQALVYWFLFLYIGGRLLSLFFFWRYPEMIRDLWGLNGFQAWKGTELMWFGVSLATTFLIGLENAYKKYKNDPSFNVSPLALLLIFLLALVLAAVLTMLWIL